MSGGLSSLFSPQRPIPALLLLFISWKVLLFLVVLTSPGPGYDTSTTLLNALELPAHGRPAIVDAGHRVRPFVLKFVRWDAIYFTSILRRGLVFEQEWAFGRGLSRPVSFLAAVLSIGSSVDGVFGIEVTAAILLSHLTHLSSVLLLYALTKNIVSRREKQDAQTPFVAAVMHIISPAGVFLSAPYTESLFSALNFLGFYFYTDSISSDTDGGSLRRDIATAASGLAFACATTMRSNGLLSGIPFLYDAVLVGLTLTTKGFSTNTFRRLFALCIGGSLIAAGALSPQYIAYRLFCKRSPAGDRRPWCDTQFPSIYGWVQSHYWNVGIFRYWTLSNLPLFLLAAPCLSMLCYSAAWAWRAEDPIMFSQSQITIGDRSHAFEQRILRRLAMPQLVLAVTALTSFHVQVITRLSSAYPLWYIWLAFVVGQSQRRGPESLGRVARLRAEIIVRWMVVYAGVQGGLFASFLPPA